MWYNIMQLRNQPANILKPSKWWEEKNSFKSEEKSSDHATLSATRSSKRLFKMEVTLLTPQNRKTHSLTKFGFQNYLIISIFSYSDPSKLRPDSRPAGLSIKLEFFTTNALLKRARFVNLTVYSPDLATMQERRPTTSQVHFTDKSNSFWFL